MTNIGRYLAEEVALDLADGIISRREALRRLGMLGLGAVAASSLLAACAKQSATPRATSAGGASPGVSPSAVATQDITFPGREGRTLRGAWAPSAQARGGVLVIHENRGLTDHIRSVAGRFADAGYSGLAIDLLSEEGGTRAVGGDAEAMAALSKVAPDRFVTDMKAGVEELGRRAAGTKLGVVGFCFGGGMVWQLLAAGEPRLSAAAPFYGPLPPNPSFAGSRNTAVLAVYAELDQRVNATRDTAKTALERDGLTHEIVTFPGVDHAFFNDTGPRYNAGQATKAWQRVIAWFGRYL
jgi:carboxymethylenebutenolidase